MTKMTAMHLIARDTDPNAAHMLDGFDVPAIMVTSDYRILATNDQYRESFGEIDIARPAHCFEVSHGYDRPCDQAGEECPLATCSESRQKERVLHIHNTPRGKEYIDVEIRPITDDQGRIKFFVELLKPVKIASAESSTAAPHSIAWWT